jgi:hypothetical protein
VVDRRWLKSLWAQNIYLLQLQKNIAIVEKDLESEESDGQEMDELCFESCAKFCEIMDIEEIEEHTRKCVGKILLSRQKRLFINNNYLLF